MIAKYFWSKTTRPLRNLQSLPFRRIVSASSASISKSSLLAYSFNAHLLLSTAQPTAGNCPEASQCGVHGSGSSRTRLPLPCQPCRTESNHRQRQSETYSPLQTTSRCFANESSRRTAQPCPPQYFWVFTLRSRQACRQVPSRWP